MEGIVCKHPVEENLVSTELSPVKELNSVLTIVSPRVDFLSGSFRYRLKNGGGRKQPLARAVGIRGDELPSVIDSTAGFAKDAFVLAALGCRVTMFERSLEMANLLTDGLQRAKDDADIGEIISRMQLVTGDSISLLATMRADVIYLDPMYPKRTKSALVKKEMQFLQRVVGADEDSDQLLQAALKSANNRVVVKRPKKAEPIDGSVSFTVSSKNTR